MILKLTAHAKHDYVNTYSLSVSLFYIGFYRVALLMFYFIRKKFKQPMMTNNYVKR